MKRLVISIKNYFRFNPIKFGFEYINDNDHDEYRRVETRYKSGEPFTWWQIYRNTMGLIIISYHKDLAPANIKWDKMSKTERAIATLDHQEKSTVFYGNIPCNIFGWMILKSIGYDFKTGKRWR